MDADALDGFLQRRQVPEQERQEILAYAAFQRELSEQTLAENTIEQELPLLSREEFERYPMLLSLAGLFRERDLPYTWEEYETHLAQTRQFGERHPGYTLVRTRGQPFRNLQIILHEGRWAMVSKNKAPAIHFVIHHPKLRGAIENFIPPVIEP